MTNPLDDVKFNCKLTIREIVTAQMSCTHLANNRMLEDTVRNWAKDATITFQRIEKEVMDKLGD